MSSSLAKKLLENRQRERRSRDVYVSSKNIVCSYHGQVIIAWEEGGPKLVDAEYLPFLTSSASNCRRMATCEELEKYQGAPKTIGNGMTLSDLRKELGALEKLKGEKSFVQRFSLDIESF